VDDPDRVRLGQRAAGLGDDPDDVARRHPPQLRQPLAEVFAVEQLHRDVRGALKDAVVEDLDDVRAAKLGRGLGLALETRLRLRQLRDLTLDELHRAGDVERQVRRQPHRSHPALPELANEPEPIGDDDVGLEQHLSPVKQREAVSRDFAPRAGGHTTQPKVYMPLPGLHKHPPVES
jgi:hypothetical protein